jgi:DNA-binding NarL/FixJ family response regulator
MSIRVVIADDQVMVRKGFRLLLEDEPDIEVVGEAADGHEAIAAARRLQPDVALMDIRMPNLDGLEATRRITASGAELPRILILTTFGLDEYVFRALRAGASGFMLKDAPAEQLLEAVRVVARGEALLAPSVTRTVVERFAALPAGEDPARADSLTPREREVLVLMTRGYSNREIAEELVIGEGTVKTHVNRVLMKLGLRDRVQAVIYGYESGLALR